MIGQTVNATMTINGDRLTERVEQLAQIGQQPNGGVCRVAFSDEDKQARWQVQKWMTEAGMTVRIDAGGNLIGRYPGQIDDAPVLATGSHIDTVPNGGRYDGAFGVLAGLEVVQTLHDQNRLLRHPIEVIVFTDEEGSMIGSKSISGSVIPDPSYYRRPTGEDIKICLQRLGGHWQHIPQACRKPEDFAAFVELHVEQGPVLETMNVQIGVVEGIVGQRRFLLTVEGQSSHAGTTPMSMRNDALVAASQVVLAVHALGNRPGQQVATVGKLDVFPNAANVIPGRVEMTLDIRDLSNYHLDNLLEQFRHQLDEIAVSTDTRIRMYAKLYNEPALMQDGIQAAIAQVCQQQNLSYTHLPSRASHDAQELAKIAPTGMIFVPSEGGISHAEVEYTSPEDCTQGANVLLQTFLLLDQRDLPSHSSH